ncbi:MAG: hypothetical protein OXU86_05720 [Thaumarchaeota archaeon]|nr:hypothetical protein [Nitrososphaerota archaeon]MDD9826249.1 hypothetical protein [Nitrososphaerota archaeon]
MVFRGGNRDFVDVQDASGSTTILVDVLHRSVTVGEHASMITTAIGYKLVS